MKRISFFCVVFVFLFCSCSTTLKMNVTRPAKLNFNGAKSIGVLPFSQSSRFPFYSNGVSFGSDFDSYSMVSSVERQVINYIQTEIEKGIANSPYVELISGTAVEKALKGKKENPADIYISGEMVTFNIFDKEMLVKKELAPGDSVSVSNVGVISDASAANLEKNDEDNIVIEKNYTREVLLVFNYQVAEGDSDIVRYFNTLKINKRCDPVTSVKELPDPYSMISYELQEFVSSFLQVLQPYSFTRKIPLLDDKSKDPDMKIGYKLAKKGTLKDCYNIFYNVYESKGLFEAGYNAAIVLMVLGDLHGAESLMSRVYNDTGNIKASEGLVDIRNEIRLNKILEEQIGE